MRCLVCGKRIGPIRRLVDRKYCGEQHRKTARKLSARALRNAEDADEFEEPWLVTPGLRDEKRPQSGTVFGPTFGILFVAAIIFVVLVAPQGSGGSPSSNTKSRSFSLTKSIQKIFPGTPSIDFTEDFTAGLNDWIGTQGTSTDDSRGWSRRGAQIRLGKLKLWKPTLSMANYQMFFQGQIEQKGMGWTFRAADFDNYYATKISIAQAGTNSRAEIIRYVVVNGKKSDRVQLPLPLSLEANVPYDVQVRIKDDRFSAIINGQVIDTWHDQRHKKGGIGFFADPGERASVNWIRITDGEDLLDRIFSFSLLIGPSDLMMAGIP